MLWAWAVVHPALAATMAGSSLPGLAMQGSGLG